MSGSCSAGGTPVRSVELPATPGSAQPLPFRVFTALPGRHPAVPSEAIEMDAPRFPVQAAARCGLRWLHIARINSPLPSSAERQVLGARPAAVPNSPTGPQGYRPQRRPGSLGKGP